MTIMTDATRVFRREGDPRVIRSGPGSRSGIDQLGRALGWFSIGLGLSQLLAAPRYTRALGLRGKEPLVRAVGAREIVQGVVTLSTERKAGLWSRVGGDALDIALLGAAAMRKNTRRGNVGLALALVVGVTVLDVIAAQAFTKRHSPRRGNVRDYRDRSGFPQGVERARGAAADFQIPVDLRKDTSSARISPVSGQTSKATEKFQYTGIVPDSPVK